MLDVAEKFEKAFNRLEFDNPSFSIALVSEGGPPNYDDWSRARHFIQFLKIFMMLHSLSLLHYMSLLTLLCINYF